MSKPAPAPRTHSAVRGFSRDWMLPATDVTAPIPLAELDRHGACAEHVQLPGLREPLCIGRGQDRELAISAALELVT